MRGVRTVLDARWESALALFEQAMTASSYTEQTVERYIRQVRQFAAELDDVAPWDITWEAYRTRLDSIPGSVQTRSTYRTSVRSFYGWALKTHRIATDPTAEPSLRAEKLMASPEWEAEILPWARSLRAMGVWSEATEKVRVAQLRRIARELPRMQPYAMTVDDILAFLATKPRWKSETKKSEVAALRSFYGWARKVGRIKKNPAKKLPPVRSRPIVVAPASEEAYALALAKADSSDRLALRLAAELGLRRAETCQVHTRDLAGPEGDRWLLVHGKGEKERRVPISDELAHLIHDRAAGNGWAFPGRHDGHMGPNRMGKRISDLLPPGVSMHKLRHRFANRAYQVNRDVFTLQQLLGHSSPATTQRYVHVGDIAKRHLVDAVRTGALAGPTS